MVKINSKKYFITVGTLSLIWIVLYVQTHPSWVQYIKESIRLTPTLQASQDSFYNSRIDPIFEKNCVACHDDNKAKGKLRLDSFRYLTFSGKSETDLTQYDNNLLVERMSLPANDRFAMPPYGRERHSEAELDLIKLWLRKGGSGNLTEDDFPEAPAKVNKITFADIDWHQIDVDRQEYQQNVKNLQQAYPHVLHYQARTSRYLILESFSIKDKFDDKTFAEFIELAPVIVELNLADTKISDNSIETMLRMTKLTQINIQGCNLTSSAVLKLAQLKHLQKLIVSEDLLNKNLESSFVELGIQLINVKQE